MADIATTLQTALYRTLDNAIDNIAKDGLTALRRVLDDAGFIKSPYLKDYQIFSHIMGHEIEYEIVFQFEAIEPRDEETRRALEESEMETEIQKLERAKKAARTYEMTRRGIRRLKDVRKSQHDARRRMPDARRTVGDARKTAEHRRAERTMSLTNPRSAIVTREGRLSVGLRRIMEETETSVRMPKDKFQGIMGQIIKQIEGVIADEFASELAKIIARYVK